MSNEFQKQVTFTAYQFNPSLVTSEFGEGSLSTLITNDLGQGVDIYEAVITANGTLSLILTVINQGVPRELFRLNPGDWIVCEGFGVYGAFTDEQFREFATPM